MPNLFTENHLLLLLLVSGALFFAIVAVGLDGILVLQSFMAEPATVAETLPTETSPSPTPTRPAVPVSDYTATDIEPISSLTSTSTLKPPATAKPTATLTPASAAGDNFSLPTATPTPTPFPFRPPILLTGQGLSAPFKLTR